ncbi:MAG: serine hydrolase [Pseudomonadota bacterium]
MVYQALRGCALALALVCAPAVEAAQYAALVMDARNGRVLHADNADTRLHPASLTKMMTLYLVFTELRAGRMKVDQKVRVSKYAASKPPSKLGLKAGQTIELRYLIRASAVKSANDAAVVLAEAVSGSEAAFARRMTEVGRAMGMRSTTFKNASGLTQTGHLSTARDMAVLGRQLFFDFPEYYNLFSRRSTNAKLTTVYNTNRRLLDAYPGADGIKTGYTRAAGFNLVSSAERGQERVIVSVFGGRSSATRNAKVAELMDLGFGKMPRTARVQRPARLRIAAPSRSTQKPATVAAAISRGAVRTSRRPMPRPAAPAEVVIAEVRQISTQSAKSVDTAVEETVVAAVQVALAAEEIAPDHSPADFAIIPPRPRPADLPVPKSIRVAAAKPPAPGRYVVELGGSYSRGEAERLLLRTALQELEALEGSERRLLPSGTGQYRAQFVGLTEAEAETACARLAARQTACAVVSLDG